MDKSTLPALMLSVCLFTSLTGMFFTSIAAASTGPYAAFTVSPSNPYTNGTVTFDASVSSPSQGATISLYHWNFGDDSDGVAQTDPLISHIYRAAGNYTVTLNVTDSSSLWNITLQTVSIHDAQLNLTVAPDRTRYSMGTDFVQISGNLSIDGNPLSDGCVALEVTNPFAVPVVFRTVPIGTASNSKVIANISKIYLSDSTGNPENSTARGAPAYLRLFVQNTGNQSISPLITINIYRERTPFYLTFFPNSTMNPGEFFGLTFPFEVPSWVNPGTATIYANVFTTFPSLGGTPIAHEESSTFTIVGTVQESIPPPHIPFNATYNFTFFLPLQADGDGFFQGYYSAYVSAHHLTYQAINSTIFQAKLIGDVNLDGFVDPVDVFSYVAPAYGTSIGHPNYDPNCDFNEDGTIDPIDVFSYLAPNYGKTTCSSCG